VATSLEYRLHDVGPEVFMAIAFYPADAGKEGILAWREIMRDAPDELMSVALWWNAPAEEPFPPEWHGKPVFILAGCWSGSLDEAERARGRQRLRAARGAVPVRDRGELGGRRRRRGQPRLGSRPLRGGKRALARRHLPQLPRLRRGGRGDPAGFARRQLRAAEGGQGEVRPGQRLPGKL